MDARPEVVVIGAGITGLACAFRVQRAGIRVVVLEASDLPGGMISTVERNGFLFEAGPQCPRFPSAVWELVLELEIENAFVPGDSRAARYIWKNGQLYKAPLSPLSFLASELVGGASKYRLATEVFRRSQPPAGEETLAEFMRRKFGDDMLTNLVDPFISAIYAGDAEQIGVESTFPFLARWEREHGSVMRGAIRNWKRSAPTRSHADTTPQPGGRQMVVTDALPTMGSFRHGLGTLPKAIAQKLGDSIRFGAGVGSIERVGSNGGPTSRWRLRLSSGEEVMTAVLVVSTPAYEAGRLLRAGAPELSAKLSEVYYAPMAVVASGYNRAQVRNPLKGFGLMIPRRENLNTFFNVWNSSIFAGRAPDGKVLLTSFAGGATNPAFVEREEAAIAQIVEGELATVLGIDGPPVERFVRKHPYAMPQFNVGHAQTAAAIRDLVSGLPGLYLAGNYLEGRSLGECVEIGTRTAEEVMRQLST
jgi:protoporphyrinogen/coproporphyrinogen III oxidase